MSTNEPMTQEQLDSIQRRVGSATEGPWSHWSGWHQWDNFVKSDSNEGLYTVADVISEAGDAAFIAHAREDIPALLAEVERLRGVLTKAREVTEDKVARAKRAFGAATAATSSIPIGMSEHTFIQGVAIQHGYAIRIALQAALGGGDNA